DIPGEALSLVVIDKLPFAPPNDPVDQARVNQMKALGQDWFGGFVLPRVIIDLKQGMGRLLRTATDRGVIALLDTRLSTRGYGERVLAELPPAPRTKSLDEVRAFFQEVR
ncbi:MAG TPA: helicase C-terminal domain-containing protein, partial [Ktedonobacteraceae bacterium]|nr:helicase C-terminal domain-containing protein [Ktedonobacteraceae bacterium]